MLVCKREGAEEVSTWESGSGTIIVMRWTKIESGFFFEQEVLHMSVRQ